MDATPTNLRQFFRGSGMTLGTLAGLGLDLKPVRAAIGPIKAKLKGAKEFASVCPYCAVGCGQIVSVRDGQIVNIEGNPGSPISRGTLCPKGSATYQLAVRPCPVWALRSVEVWPPRTRWTCVSPTPS